MRLEKCLESIKGEVKVAQFAALEKEVLRLNADSREVEEGDLFFCLTGGKLDGHIFAQQAVKKGAVAIVCERELSVEVPQIIVKNTRIALSEAAACFYGYAHKKLKIIGITGALPDIAISAAPFLMGCKSSLTRFLVPSGKITTFLP